MKKFTYTTEHITSLHGDPVWQAIWTAIKDWDISRAGPGSYHAPTGDDVTAIYEAVMAELVMSELVAAGQALEPK